MYAKYGNNQHPANEVNLVSTSARARYSPRNRKLSTVITINLEGEVLADTQEAINDLIAERERWYEEDGLDFGFYTDDGLLTRHRLLNDATCISGTQVVFKSWPKGDAAEFATKRTYALTLQAEYLTPDSQLVSWEEQVEYIGNCGPRFEVVETYLGPVSLLVSRRTSQKIIQSGSAIGFQGYVLPPGSLLPAIEHQDLRRVTVGSAQAKGRMGLFYPSSWTYTHTSDRYREVFPVSR